jgi:predicted nucleotidyltransferase
MPKDDQQKVEAFLREFVSTLTEQHAKEIDFILLFGSAARGEFVLGKSDVDLIIQVKSDEKRKEVEGFAEKVFWQLDRKHGMQLKRVCSTGIGASVLENAVKALEAQARLYKPFEVFGPKDIDWRRGMIKRLDLLPGAFLVASQLTLLYKMKKEGKILFGRDIRKEIRPRFTLWEKLKSLFVPQSISFAALALSLLMPKKAVGYAVKAIFYEVESVNLFLQNKIPKKGKLGAFAKATEFRNQLLDDLRFCIELRFGLLGEQKLAFVKKAAAVKKNGFQGSRVAALRFCFNAFWVIYSCNSSIILKTIFGIA